MTRNNLENIGMPNKLSVDEPIQTINNDLSLPQPTEVVELVTKGMFYPKDHPLHHYEVVEIRHMTTKDLEILNSKSLLQKGMAVDKMLQGLLVNKTIKIDDLFICDKNAIVLASRITGFTAEFTTIVVCPSCENKSEHTFNLNEVKPKDIPEDVVVLENGTFDITLPKSKAKLTLRLLMGKDEKTLKMMIEKKKRHKLPETPFADQLKQIIVSINDNADGNNIDKFVDEMLAIDTIFLKNEYNRISPNIDMKQDFICECGAENNIIIPFNVDFFWSNR